MNNGMTDVYVDKQEKYDNIDTKRLKVHVKSEDAYGDLAQDVKTKKVTRLKKDKLGKRTGKIKYVKISNRRSIY